MTAEGTIHNPDRYMADLRQVISQGKKKIGLLIGAGAPVAVRINEAGELDSQGKALIPDVAGLTSLVLGKLDDSDKKAVEALLPELGSNPNIEAILTRIRRLAEAIGSAEVYNLNAEAYRDLAESICSNIGEIVASELPSQPNPYTDLVSWIAGTNRDHCVEIFTPNYDLLIEEAFERLRLPYFDGFTGSHKPFFDPTSIANDILPPRWSRLWKIHGSLGWDVENDAVVRTGKRNATKLIYPDHLKYDQITRQPYSALFNRLKDFLLTPDSILICSGFSFYDSHICAVIGEALAANAHTSVLAFQFKNLAEESYAKKLAMLRPNLSVYARDGAVIFGAEGLWQPGQAPFEEWESIRKTFWRFGGSGNPGEFILGDFASLSKFFALSHAQEFRANRVAFEEDAADSKAEETDASS